MDLTLAARTHLVPLQEVLFHACITHTFRPVMVHP
jgi:hypothetical protein